MRRSRMAAIGELFRVSDSIAHNQQPATLVSHSRRYFKLAAPEAPLLIALVKYGFSCGSFRNHSRELE
jgi:hypothetical protein